MGSVHPARDELDIQRLLTQYAWACDNDDPELLASLFTAGAHLDFTRAGGAAGPRDDVLPWLVAGLRRVEWIQHAVTNFEVDVDGDRARARALLHVCARFPGVEDMLTAGGYYVTELVRTSAGWRIQELCEDTRWMEGPTGG